MSQEQTKLTVEQVKRELAEAKSGWGACMYDDDFGVWARNHGEELMAIAAEWLEQRQALEQIADYETWWNEQHEIARRALVKDVVTQSEHNPPHTQPHCVYCGQEILQDDGFKHDSVGQWAHTRCLPPDVLWDSLPEAAKKYLRRTAKWL